MGSNASAEENQKDNGTFGNSTPELFPKHKPTNEPTSVSNGTAIKPPQEIQERTANNKKPIGKKGPEKQPEAALDSDMHFIVDTFNSVEKMTTKETNKRKRWLRRNKGNDDTKNTPVESTSAPNLRLSKSPKLETENEVKGFLAKGKQFILRRQPVTKPRTAPSTSCGENKEENEDEWQYQKIVIDGFDPEKFKQANAAQKPNVDSRLSEAQTISSVKPNGDSLVLRIRSTEMQELAVPSAYDFTDEQLMTTIEKEFKE